MSVLLPSLIALPLAGFVLISLIPLKGRIPAFTASFFTAGAFASALAAFVGLAALSADDRAVVLPLWSWIRSSGFDAPVRLLYDPLSAVMCVVVTGVALLVHLYSIEYMAGDRGYRRYFAQLNLFVAAMLLLVLADNYLLLMAGWSGVGLSSYLLIGHWRERAGVSEAATKAFLVNMLGDLGLMAAVILLWTRTGHVGYAGVFGRAAQLSSGAALAVALCLLVAAAAKSAQVPLQVWLPDAMAGPTPVSALIHAATMVTAGVYLMARSAPLLVRSDTAMLLVASIGAVTTLVGALGASSQSNLKRVLAYSTISQLGYMFLGVGVGAYGAGMFHLVTHALYKACLFLAAGVVIHALHGEEEMARMGGLRRRLVAVYLAMLSGGAALAGIPPFSGFWSKDEVLAAAFLAPHGSWLLGVLGLVSSALTGYYVTRMLLLVFHGEPRARVDLHAPGALLWVPVALLGVLSLAGGVVQYLGSMGTLSQWLHPAWAAGQPFDPELSVSYWLVSLAAVLLALAGAAYAFRLHSRGALSADRVSPALRHGLYFDRAYSAALLRPAAGVGRFFTAVFEPRLLDRLVAGVGGTVRSAGLDLSGFQNGSMRSYALTLLGGTAMLLGYVLWVVR